MESLAPDSVTAAAGLAPVFVRAMASAPGMPPTLAQSRKCFWLPDMQPTRGSCSPAWNWRRPGGRSVCPLFALRSERRDSTALPTAGLPRGGHRLSPIDSRKLCRSLKLRSNRSRCSELRNFRQAASTGCTALLLSRVAAIPPALKGAARHNDILGTGSSRAPYPFQVRSCAISGRLGSNSCDFTE